MITYAIADDHTIFRQGLRYALADDRQLKCIGDVANGSQLLALFKDQIPDVILLDLKMPEMDGITVTQALQQLYPGIKILMLTSFDDEHIIMHLLELGVSGYLLKNADSEEIKKAIHTVHETGHYFNDLVSNTMLKALTLKNNSAQKQKDEILLSDRETEVLKLICQELTTTEIAARIFLSPRTVEGIRSSLIEKTGVKNIAGLVIYALKKEIVK